MPGIRNTSPTVYYANCCSPKEKKLCNKITLN